MTHCAEVFEILRTMNNPLINSQMNFLLVVFEVQICPLIEFDQRGRDLADWHLDPDQRALSPSFRKSKSEEDPLESFMKIFAEMWIPTEQPGSKHNVFNRFYLC